MTTRTIHLARHATHSEVGTILSGRSDIALSERGRAEAGRLAARLGGERLAAIVSSPRRRARETAAAVAGTCGLPVVIDEGLDEIDFGSWSGRRFDALAADPGWRRWNEARGSAATPAGDTMAAALARALACVARRAQDGAVLCVSHADVIRALVAHHLGLGLDRIFAFECAPASLTTLALDAAGARLVALNERPA